MRYTVFGRSGLRVSELCLGTMTFGDDWGWGADRDGSRRMFEAFAAAGGTFLDTAANYTDGSSETILGELLAADRDHFVVGTKYGLSTRPDDPNAGGVGRKNLLASLRRSLRRLRTDHVDLLWLHMWDSSTPVEEVMRSLDAVVRAGLALHVGVSDTPAWVVARANTLAELRGWAPFAGLQVEYGLGERSAERDLLPMARELGLAVTPWGVLDGGVLTGKYAAADPGPTREDPARVPAARLARSAAVADVAADLGASPAQVALAWVRARGAQLGVQVVPVLGARTPEQLADNLGSLDVRLDGDSLRRLDEAAPVDLGFPHEFLAGAHARRLIHGAVVDRLDLPAVAGSGG